MLFDVELTINDREDGTRLVTITSITFVVPDKGASAA